MPAYQHPGQEHNTAPTINKMTLTQTAKKPKAKLTFIHFWWEHNQFRFEDLNLGSCTNKTRTLNNLGINSVSPEEIIKDFCGFQVT